ncbi:MAG TPA: 2OG-Fe(II) oxygenase [Pyrinomonadaceae bacterium]|nr:2OG-Fe(II) oxygenase [Pyrinomonadaceae bacterium]
MPKADFFKNFGIYAEPNFLDGETCARLVAGLEGGGRAPAQVYKDHYAREVDERARRTVRVAAPAAVTSELRARLSGLRAALEESFGLALGDCEEPEFLAYGPGDFFRPHQDAAPHGQVHEYLKRRSVSAVLFLNGQREEPAPGSFCGGSLVFYGLVKDARAAGLGFPLEAEPGLLVAFPSDTLHEVTPVTHGDRYTVVTWFAGETFSRHPR